MFKIKKNLSLNILVVGVLIGTLLLTLFSVAQNYGLIGKDLSKDKFSFLMPNNAVYLYAETEPNTYTIYFDGNGGEGTMNNMSMTYDNSENLLKNEFEKEGYVFKGWSRTKAGLVKYLDQSEVKNLTATNSGKVTLYAQREPEFPYTVEYYHENIAGTGFDLVGVGKPYTESGTTRTGIMYTGYIWTGILYTGYIWTKTLYTGYTRTGTYTGYNTGYMQTGMIYTGYTQTGMMYTGYTGYTWNTGNTSTGAYTWNTGNTSTGILYTGYRRTKTLYTGYTRTGILYTGYIQTGVVYTGFTQTGAEVVSNPDGSQVLKYNYKRETYNLTVEDRDNELISTGVKFKGDIESIIPSDVTGWTGHEFIGWDNVPENGEMPANDLKIESVWAREIHSITFNTDGGSEIAPIVGSYEDEISVPADPTKRGYEFLGWDSEVPTEISYEDITVNAMWSPEVHSITFNTDGGSEIAPIVGNYEDKISIPANPTKEGYEFAGWEPELPTAISYEDITVKAKWIEIEEESYPGWSGGGGRKKSSDSEGDHESAGQSTEGISKNKSSMEVLLAYMWAHNRGIVNESRKDSNPDGYVTRGDMAEMLVKFTEKVIKKEVTSIPAHCKWGDTDWKSRTAKSYAEKSCALGVMGIRMQNFMPNKILDRAEFGTILSRLLWGDKYDIIDATGKKPYYTKHLEALKKEGVMTQIDNPVSRQELRKWAWLMLMRVESKVL